MLFRFWQDEWWEKCKSIRWRYNLTKYTPQYHNKFFVITYKKMLKTILVNIFNFSGKKITDRRTEPQKRNIKKVSLIW